MQWSNILKIVLIVVILALIGWLLYKQFSKPTKAPYQQSSNGSGKEAEVLYFYTDWCPHCKTASPEVTAVITELNNTSVNGYKINFKEINCTTDNPEVESLTSTYKVDGYPTIKLIKDNEVIDYDAKPDRNTLTQFITTTLS